MSEKNRPINITSVKFFKKYIQDFSSKDIGKIEKYYNLPIAILNTKLESKPIVILKNRKDLRKYFSNLFKTLNKIYDYKLTKLDHFKLLKKNDKYQIIQILATRYNKNKLVMKKLSIQYFLEKKSNRFKIIGFLIK